MLRNISQQKKVILTHFKRLNALEEKPILDFCVRKLLICIYMNPVAGVSVRQSKKPLDCLLFFPFFFFLFPFGDFREMANRCQGTAFRRSPGLDGFRTG